MASSRLVPVLVAGGVGVLGGLYIWKQPMQELSGNVPKSEPVKDGRSQNKKDGTHESGSTTNPHTSLQYGGASPVKPDSQTIAGTTADAKRSYSADHNVKTRENPKEQDGTSGGGVGVAEMRERKMQGQGLPSPQASQGGDTKAQPVAARANDGEMGGVKKQGRWWLGGW